MALPFCTPSMHLHADRKDLLFYVDVRIVNIYVGAAGSGGVASQCVGCGRCQLGGCHS